MAEDPPASPRRQHGHSRAYILDRLRRENRVDLLEAVEASTISAFAAGCEAGYFTRPPTLAAVTHQARRRRQRFQAIDGELSSGQMMELQYGPSPSAGSLFSSREELVGAWQQARECLMASSNPGRRPQGFYEFEFDGPRPPYDTERSVLWRKDLLTADEKVTLEAEWAQEYARAQAADFTLSDGSGELLVGDCARAAHYQWADIPRELIKRWEKAERRRRARGKRRPVAPSAGLEEAAAIK
jgi:hypothetical protein